MFIDDNGIGVFVDDVGLTMWVDDNGLLLGGRLFTITLV